MAGEPGAKRAKRTHRITIDFIMAAEAEDIRPSRTITLASYVAERQPLHPSHDLGQHRGVRWCWICGAYSTNLRARKLLERCSNLPSKYGRRVLERVSEWPPTPPPGVQWPLQLAVGDLRPRGASSSESFYEEVDQASGHVASKELGFESYRVD